ncbi:5-carboxymethyl-2-hydroxymuconate delta-isomerase [Mariniradius saccharolyticus AK6]|uniref:5-carboxymethyl-2-hydroxymuconate delta-isomerase n=1 Tax=Mariniradius saccharolyticus AK6 TaxID=1239962 RepID=M7XIM3_9BACT|nr:5-carboxymethyl-2-hydroxymuconate Delta-isomerase [Mariniradius saccharolyticus]EMS34368.1 5-carboxymethyl-2-hydroxymuconate delta-isomerase [Mariniradius saccharolyticus AK6]
MNTKAFILFFNLVLITGWLSAQTISKEEMIFLTSEWKGERFPDGRPRIPDDLLERAKRIMIDDAWNALRNEGYHNQFEGGWKMVNETLMTGRAVTAMYLPSRPDVERNIKERGARQGRKGNTNSWPIDTLVPGDLYVADAYGKIGGGPIMGSTLANSIFSKSGNGVVFDGAARDLQEIRNMKGFNAFVRDFHPSFTEEMVLMGLNTPIRIGGAIVLPGDLVIATVEGVLFVPAHLAEQVVSVAEFVVRKDQFGFEMVRNNIYSTGEIDSQWTDEIKTAFLKWLEKRPDLGTMTRQELDQMMSKRTW